MHVHNLGEANSIKLFYSHFTFKGCILPCLPIMLLREEARGRYNIEVSQQTMTQPNSRCSRAMLLEMQLPLGCVDLVSIVKLLQRLVIEETVKLWC